MVYPEARFSQRTEEREPHSIIRTPPHPWSGKRSLHALHVGGAMRVQQEIVPPPLQQHTKRIIEMHTHTTEWHCGVLRSPRSLRVG